MAAAAAPLELALELEFETEPTLLVLGCELLLSGAAAAEENPEYHWGHIEGHCAADGKPLAMVSGMVVVVVGSVRLYEAGGGSANGDGCW